MVMIYSIQYSNSTSQGLYGSAVTIWRPLFCPTLYKWSQLKPAQQYPTMSFIPWSHYSVTELEQFVRAYD